MIKKGIPHLFDATWGNSWHPADNRPTVRAYSSGEFNRVDDIPDRAQRTIDETR
jgi:hypothetical protein